MNRAVIFLYRISISATEGSACPDNGISSHILEPETNNDDKDDCFEVSWREIFKQ